jgi:hypothetical protein
VGRGGPRGSGRTRGTLAFLALCWLAPTVAQAETTGCQGVGTLPATISAPGNYCLNSDVSKAFAGRAIHINADDVVLDCNGHTIRNTVPANLPNGIATSGPRQNVTVRNCVVDGFYVGIYLTGLDDHTTRGGRIEDNTARNSLLAGVYAFGSNHRIERNRILGSVGYNTGLYGIVLGSFESNTVGNSVRDNHISDARPTNPDTSVYAIEFSGSHGASITGNVLTGLYAGSDGNVTAIVGYGVTQAEVARNVLLAAPALPSPLDGPPAWGIRLNGTSEQQATNVCQDNVVGHWATNVWGCQAVGNSSF